MLDELKLKFTYSANFWQKIESAESLTSEYIDEVLQENQKSKVVLPENMILKKLLADNKNMTEHKAKHLSPARYVNSYFMADNIDIHLVRNDMASMEHPIFALKSGDDNIVYYESNNVKTTIIPGAKIGRATVHDKDVWIYCISKLMQAKFENKAINRVIRFSIYEFLKQTNRTTGGSAYEQFKLSLQRLRATTIQTEIKTGGLVETELFGLLDGAKLALNEKTDKIDFVEVTLPEWLYRSITSNEILNIHPDYFRLKKAVDRRIYEIARKHCGNKKSWTISIEKLYSKSGSTGEVRNFRSSIKALAKSSVLPDFIIEYDRDSDMVTFFNQDLNKKIDSIVKNLTNYN